MAAPLAQPATLTDAQFDALDAAANRGDTHIHRGPGVGEATLRGLALRGLGELCHDDPARRFRITGLRISKAGWMAWSDESDRRERAMVAAKLAELRRAEVDPFAVHNDAAARRERAIDAAFAL